MKIKEHKLFRWDSFWFGDWLWLAVTLGPLAVVLQALRYNYAITQTGIPVGGWVTYIAAIAAFWGITIYRYYHRHKFIESIQFYTDQGMAVVFANKNAEKNVANVSDLDDLQVSTSKALDTTIDFWEKWGEDDFENPTTRDDIVAAFNGGVLTITDEPFKVRSTHGPMAATFKQKFLGISFLNQIVITMDNDAIKTSDSLLKLLRHEAAHTCLNQLGVMDNTGGKSHHEIFQRASFDA